MIMEKCIDPTISTKLICPNCNENTCIKYGKFNNKQRFLCKSCKKTFSTRTNTPWYYSKKSNETWEEFCNLLLAKATLKECAEKLKINIATAFYWRHKILNALEVDTEAANLKGNVSLFKEFMNESYKGVPYARYKKKGRLWIIISADSSDSIIAKPISKHNWNKENFDKIIYDKIVPNTYLNAFNDRFLIYIAKINNANLKKKDSHASNELLKNFFINYKYIKRKTFGFATKYLGHYFALAKTFSLNKKFSTYSILNQQYPKNVYIKSSDIKWLKNTIS